MNKLHVYHVSQHDLGDEFLFSPMIPEFKVFDEDSTTKRICCCLSITDCIMAISTIPYDIYTNGPKDIYVYTTYVDINDIIQPTINQVSDVWCTGELWVTKPYTFTKLIHYRVSLQMDYPNTPYSRYQFVSDDDYPVADRIYADTIYMEIWMVLVCL